MIISHGKFLIREDQLEKAKAAMKKMSLLSALEPGCISYDYFFSLTNPRVVLLFQEWESVDALNQHFTTTHMAEFLGVLPDFLDGEIISHRYAVKHPTDTKAQSEPEFEFGEEPVTLH